MFSSTITFLFLLFSLTITSPCFGLTIPQSPTLNVDNFSDWKANNTLQIPDGPYRPDPRFQANPFFWGTDLKSTRAFFVTVNAMANLAMRGFEEDIGETVFTLPDHPEVAIVVLPKNWQWGGQMERRFAVWGLFFAIWDMNKNKSWRCNTVHLLWDGEEVGTIGFSRGVIRRPQLSLATTEHSLQAQGVIAVHPNVTVLSRFTSTRPMNVTAFDILPSTGLATEPVLSVNIDLRPTILPIQTIFIAVIGALANIAAVPDKDAPVVTFMAQQAPVNAWISFNAIGRRGKRVPKMNYRHVVDTLGLIPEYMMQMRKFSEATVLMLLNGQEVGLGIVKKLIES